MKEYEFRPAERHWGLAIASVVLGSISCFCCIGSGLGVIPAVIAIVFGIISIASGSERSRKIGWIGLITGIVGLLINLVVIIVVIRAVNWDMVTWERLATIQWVDMDNEVEVINWLQQFFKVDLSRLLQ